jgi:AraC-like DNA-binding protein
MQCALPVPDRATGSDSRADVLTVVEAPLRSHLSLALRDVARPLHVDSLAAAIAATTSRPVRAVLLGEPAISGFEPATVSRLAAISGGTVIAVFRGWTPEIPHGLLSLGRCGVREVVDLGSRDGLGRLRTLLSWPEWETAHRIEQTFAPSLAEATDDMREFMRHVVRTAPAESTARGLARGLGLRCNSMGSRFFRARLPSPKEYLTAVRLLYAAAAFEKCGASVAQVAMRLNYSSPQSFGRHVREQLGVRAGEFSNRYSFDQLAEHVAFRVLEKHRQTLRWFRPLALPPHPDAAGE